MAIPDTTGQEAPLTLHTGPVAVCRVRVTPGVTPKLPMHFYTTIPVNCSAMTLQRRFSLSRRCRELTHSTGETFTERLVVCGVVLKPLCEQLKKLVSIAQVRQHHNIFVCLFAGQFMPLVEDQSVLRVSSCVRIHDVKGVNTFKCPLPEQVQEPRLMCRGRLLSTSGKYDLLSYRIGFIFCRSKRRIQRSIAV